MQQRQFVTLPLRSGLAAAARARIIFTFCMCYSSSSSASSSSSLICLLTFWSLAAAARNLDFGSQRYQDVISGGGSGDRRLDVSEKRRQLVPLQGEDNMFYCANTVAQPQRCWPCRSCCKETTQRDWFTQNNIQLFLFLHVLFSAY